MQWYVYLISIPAAVFLAQVGVELICQPLRTVFRLRRKALARMRWCQNMPLPRPRELAISSREIREYDQAVGNLKEAHLAFADLGTQLLAVGENEPAIRILVAMFGFDMVLAGRELIKLSEVCAAGKTDGDHLRQAIGKALCATRTVLAVSRSVSGNDLLQIRPEPMSLARLRYKKPNSAPGKPRMVSRHASPRVKPSSPAATTARADRFHFPAARPDLSRSQFPRDGNGAFSRTG